MRRFLPLLALLLLPACVSVDETEWCVQTRYGKVVTERLPVGLSGGMTTEETCFSLTDQVFPPEGSAEKIAAMTSDPLTVQGDVSIVYALDQSSFMADVFLVKRSPAAVEGEVLNAIREGYRNAVSSWTVQEIAENRAALADSVQTHIQRKLGKLATVKRVYVRDIAFPEQIETARIEAVKRASQLDAARKQLAIDSTQASGQVIKARALADAKRLEAEAYAQNSRLIDVEVAKHLSQICAKSATCILGGSALDKLFTQKED